MEKIEGYFFLSLISFPCWWYQLAVIFLWTLLVFSHFEAYPFPIEIFENCGSWPVSRADLIQFFFFFNLIAIWKLSTGPRPHSLLGSKLRLDSWFPDRQFSTLSIVPNPQSLFEIKFNFAPSGEKLKEDLLHKSWLFWELKALTDLSFQRIIHNLKYSFPKT